MHIVDLRMLYWILSLNIGLTEIPNVSRICNFLRGSISYEDYHILFTNLINYTMEILKLSKVEFRKILEITMDRYPLLSV